ncbi:post-GPI attachment to proteins factor 2-like [Anthonomus grandis grandis]|uniref:post-GPI attachment to proteins factor 2-like n=1 Tax=Anthonomus grandis grandis TaxID=2921223 RepID=UPI00216561EE|nr:post-GPI attachment to proteins factor 2-like [Anthonomus grandis grandis]
MESQIMPNTIPERNESKGEMIIHYRINFKYVCLCTVTIPLAALVICLVSAYIFQFDDVHETHCRVFNIVPSISAITGVSPQRYIWRISVALHIGPRVIISAVYNAYQLKKINPLAEPNLKTKAQLWLNLAYVLNLIETAALCGVTYISNKENYPIHEKLFIIFMVSSLTYMVACIQGTKMAAETRKDLQSIQEGLKYKKNLLVLSLYCTAGLVIFFLQHRFLCYRMAFSMFALCEYVIAGANMAFHISVILDFPTEELMVGKYIVPSEKECSGDTHHKVE